MRTKPLHKQYILTIFEHDFDKSRIMTTLIPIEYDQHKQTILGQTSYKEVSQYATTCPIQT